MATIYLEWDNTAVNASGNALNQRLSWRQKTVGGSFFTSGTTPANDMAKTVNSASHDTAVVNKIYEYKVEALCTIGGPTPNSNGIQEGIAFECLPLSTLTSTVNSVTVDTNLTGTDITKVRYTLRKQSDNSLVSTSLVTVVANAAPNTFSGLTDSTGYYVQVSLLTTVNAVEVESSSAEYLAVSCGGNVVGYQISTSAPSNIQIENTSLDVNLEDIKLDGVSAPGTYAIPGDSDSFHFVSNDGTVDLYIEWNPTVASGQHITVTDTNGTFVTCIDISIGDPTPFETITGVDMTGPNNLLIQIMDGTC